MTPVVATLCLFVAITLANTSTASTPRSSEIDSSFGTGGRAAVSFPRGTALDLTSDLASVASGRDGSQFVVAPFSNRRTSKISGGIVQKFNTRGRAPVGFGRSGILRFPTGRTPAELHELSDGSLILTTVSIRKQRFRYWIVMRLREDGTTVKTFGESGTIKLRIPDAGNNSPPLVMPLDRGRFGVVGLDGNTNFPGNRLFVFDRTGKPDRDFADRGHKDFSFQVEAATPVEGGDILVGGSESTVQIARIDRRGNPVQTWGTGGIAATDPFTIKQWARDFDSKYMTPEAFGVGQVQFAVVKRRLVVTFRTFLDYEDGLYDYGWAVRFDARGKLDTSWGVGGRRALGSSYNSSESDEGDYSELDMAPLPDGRIFYGEYFNGSWSTYNSYLLRVAGASGKLNSKGSRSMRMRGFREFAHTISKDGRHYFAFGERKGRDVVTWVRF